MAERPVDRSAQIAAFLAAAGWQAAARRILAADASFRRYERLDGPHGRARGSLDDRSLRH